MVTQKSLKRWSTLSRDGYTKEPKEMDHHSFDEFLYGLENLEKIQFLSKKRADAFENKVQQLKMEFRFLKTFSVCIARDENLKNLSALTVSAIKHASEDLFSKILWQENLDMNTSDAVYYALLGIQDLMYEMRYFYEQVSESSRSYTPTSIDFLRDFINNLVQNLQDLQSPEAYFLFSFKDEIVTLKEKLSSLWTSLDFAAKQRREDEDFKDLLIRSEDVTVDAASLSYTCFAYQIQNLKPKFSDLVEKMDLIMSELREMCIGVQKTSKSTDSSGTYTNEARILEGSADSVHAYLMEILLSTSRFTSPIQETLKRLDDELRFLKTLLMDPPRQYIEPEKLDDLLRSIHAVTTDSCSLISSLHASNITEKIALEMNLLLVDLLERMKYIKAEATDIYLKVSKPSRSKFPRTNGLGFIQFFLENLKELQSHKDNSIVYLKNQIEAVRKGFESLSSLLGNMEEKLDQQVELKCLWTRVIDVAYHAEYVIDSFVIKDGPVWYYMLWLDDVVKEIHLIKADAFEIYKNLPHETGVHSVMKPSSSTLFSQATTPTITEQVVGFTDEAEKIVQLLIKGSGDVLDIVSIVGMPGIGKTTLSKKVYNSLSVENHFHVRAWCCVSQVYEKRHLLLSILSHIMQLTEEIYKLNEYDLAEFVYKKLKGRRYLVVMDDIWNIKAWRDLHMSFPDDKNGSRIVFTTRLLDVALQAKLHSNPHSLRSLNDNECWELLQQLLFSKESFPSKLKDIGKKIALNCKGVPLSVVLVCGLLAADKTRHFWEQVAERLTSRIIDDPQTHCMDIIGLSYKHLPDHLKPCFLYFGAFLEDQEVPAQKLIWSWNAEGFVKKAEGKSIDETAEDYLMDLVSRSLITIAKCKSNGRIKGCRIHDLLIHFCKIKSREENFWQFIEGKNDPFTSDAPDCGVRSDFSSLANIAYEQHRLCIYPEDYEYFIAKSGSSCVRSLHLLAASENKPTDRSDASFISNNFELLRVLDLLGPNVHCLSGLERLVHLKYLAVRTSAKAIPQSIANLWNLETFLVEAGLPILIPESIWKMRKLRHLQIRAIGIFMSDYQRRLESKSNSSNNQTQGSFVESNQLHNLESISSVRLGAWEVEEILKKIPNVRKLKCFWVNRIGNSSVSLKLTMLKKLESLSVHYLKFPCEVSLPSILKSLTLSSCYISWTEISTIGKLENLEVLKLQNLFSEGKRWHMIDGEFGKLRHLQLSELNLEEWNASGDHFPCLQRLRLQRCYELKEVPSCLGELETLEMIEVKWCSMLDLGSVWQIRQGQEDLGNDHFKLLIQT